MNKKERYILSFLFARKEFENGLDKEFVKGGKRKNLSNKCRIGENRGMKSTLIKDTTKEERIALIRSWIPDDDGLADCEIDLWDMYADYINGKREIAEINASFQTDFYME